MKDVVIPVVTGILNLGSAGAGQNSGLWENDGREADPTVESDGDEGNTGVPAVATPPVETPEQLVPNLLLQSPEQRQVEMQRRWEFMWEHANRAPGPTIENRSPASCGMDCPVITDHPINDGPDPREEKSAEPRPTDQEIFD